MTCKSNYWSMLIGYRFAPENRTDEQQYTFLPFGQGNRSCIARRLAILEIRVAIMKLLMKFNIEKTAETPAPVKHVNQIAVLFEYPFVLSDAK